MQIQLKNLLSIVLNRVVQQVKQIVSTQNGMRWTARSYVIEF